MKWALLAFFAALPLQWWPVHLPLVGSLRLHVLAMLVFAALALARMSRAAVVPVMTVAWPFVAGICVLLLVGGATAVYHGGSPMGAVRDALLLAVFTAVGAATFSASRGTAAGMAVLRWSALATAVALIVAMALSLASVGADPVAILRDTVKHANPTILQTQLFHPAFQGFGIAADSARAHLRHEVFGSVLVAMCVAVAAERIRPLRSPSAVLLFRASLVLGALLIVISLSRSVILAALSWPLLATWQSLQRGRLSMRQVLSVVTAAGAAAALAASGFLNVVWVHFTSDTTSYQKRSGLLGLAVTNIRSHLLTGGVETVGESSHNFVLDSWLRSGAFAALAALLVTVLLAGLWLGIASRLGGEPPWMLPILVALTLAINRIFTAGGGSIPPVEWVALGVVAGFLAHRRETLHSGSTHSSERLVATP